MWTRVARWPAGARAATVTAVAVLSLAACSTAATRPIERARPVPAPPHPVPAAAPVRAIDPIAADNAQPGTTAWRIPRGADTTVVEGYADRSSVLPGEPFRLYVSTPAARWTVAAYRMGWYAGAEGRLVWRASGLPGGTQRAPVVDSRRTVEAGWRPSLTVPTLGWLPGDYLLLLTTPSGGAHYVPIVVRSPSVAGRVVLLNAVLTWEAYNVWGGYSLYGGPSGTFADRSLAVSFDRPYDGDGAVKFLAFEQPVVAEAERLGVPVAYETSVDVATDPGVLTGAAAVVSMGHDEYWTESERAAVLAARDAGTNLAFLGANAEYWRVRLGATSVGPDRLVVGYKDASLDPVAATGEPDVTTRFRDGPRPEPESELTGLQYECFPAAGAYVVIRPDFWLFAGTGARAGTALPGLVGVEIDRAYPLPTTPRPLDVVAHSPVSCDGVATYSDSAYYVAPSGAGVFATGTMRWTCALAGHCRSHGVDDATIGFTRRVTDNLLRAFATPRDGAAHRAYGDLAALRESAVDMTGAA
jgi:hypothetical protein